MLANFTVIILQTFTKALKLNLSKEEMDIAVLTEEIRTETNSAEFQIYKTENNFEDLAILCKKYMILIT